LTSPASMPSVAVKILGPYKETESWFWLVRFDPGVEFPAHAHPSVEHNYTLEGEFELKGKVYGPRTYMIFPEGVEHGPLKVVGEKPWLCIASLTGLSGLEEMVTELKLFME